MREELFWAKVERGDDCWTWNGSHNQDGYGHHTWRENGKVRTRGAHVLAYELHHGVTVSETIDHLCRNTGCVNPAHLEPVTMRENILRGTSPAALNARKTHRKRGHPLSGANLKIKHGPYGQMRKCRRCDADAAARRKAKRCLESA